MTPTSRNSASVEDRPNRSHLHLFERPGNGMLCGVPVWTFQYKLLHHPFRFLQGIYPLTREQYRQKSLARRASYSYLNEIVEVAFNATGSLALLITTEIGNTYKERFARSAELGILPMSVCRELGRLAWLRNKAIHNNPLFDSQLLLYDRMIDLIVTGFATCETLVAILWCAEPSRHPGLTERVVVGTAYIEELIGTVATSREGWAKSGTAVRRLQSERHVPRHVIDYTTVGRFVQQAIEGTHTRI
jgi:uncharacterized protein YutE (UPF0331/DUF86 family)